MSHDLTLPVRKLEMFGYQTVIPNDTACDINIRTRYKVEDDGSEIRATVTVEIVLSHIHFGKSRSYPFCVFRVVNRDQRFIKNRTERKSVSWYSPSLTRLTPKPRNVEAFAKRIDTERIKGVLFAGFLKGEMRQEDIQ